MTTLEQAARLALEALCASGTGYGVDVDAYWRQQQNAIAKLREALEQPAQQQEPVAKVVRTAPDRIWLDLGFDPEVDGEVSFDDLFDATWSHDNATGNGIEYIRADLYAPQQRKTFVGLTDHEINKVRWDWIDSTGDYLDFARVIEAKLREKNT